MKYATQRIAYYYFAGAMILFAVQVLVGALAGTVYVLPNFLAETLPFNILRMIHTNALIVWLLMGFFGCVLPHPGRGRARHREPAPRLHPARPLMFGARRRHRLCLRYPRGPRVSGAAALDQDRDRRGGPDLPLQYLDDGLERAQDGHHERSSARAVGHRPLLLFAFYNPANVALDKLYWWYVVHLWVEGVWELVMASVLAFLIIKMTGVDREVIEKWLYAIAGLALFSGLLGTGHHYYWIGAPGYWQWIGSIFSTLEIAPFFAMVVFAFTMVWRAARPSQPGRPALVARLHRRRVLRCRHLGLHAHAVVRELLQPRHADHRRHGHLAFFGAYVMLNLAIRDAVPPQPAAVQSAAQYVELLDHDVGDGVHDVHADVRRRRASPSAARDGHDLHGGPGPDRALLLDAADLGGMSSCRRFCSSIRSSARESPRA